MPKFNDAGRIQDKAISHEGGAVYDKSLEDEWSNILFSSFLEPGYYRGMHDVQKRFAELTEIMIHRHGAEFAARAACYSRNVLGLRSASAVVAALADGYRFDGKRSFFKSYFHRPDDVAEVFSAVDILGGKKSHALMKGAADYLGTLDEYSIGKYKMAGNGNKYNMYDLVNLTHATSPAIDEFKNGTLPIPYTWESVISSTDDKRSAWMELVGSGKLGYMALIRNLSNILATDPGDGFIHGSLIPAIENKSAIRGSLIYPYRIYQAYSQVEWRMDDALRAAMSNAFKISMGNFPKFDGRTLIILDASDSMNCPASRMSSMTYRDISSVYASAIALGNPDADIIAFAQDAKSIQIDTDDPFEMIYELSSIYVGCSTHIAQVFESLDKRYDRIFLFSDMQVMDDGCEYIDLMIDGPGKSAHDCYMRYMGEYGHCRMYSFDMGSYGTQILDPGTDGIMYITCLNDNAFKFIEMHESGVPMIDAINGYDRG